MLCREIIFYYFEGHKKQKYLMVKIKIFVDEVKHSYSQNCILYDLASAIINPVSPIY